MIPHCGILDMQTHSVLLSYNATRRNNSALHATMRVLAVIKTAAAAGESTTPHGAAMPAASGSATMLYPAAHQRFWTILR